MSQVLLYTGYWVQGAWAKEQATVAKGKWFLPRTGAPSHRQPPFLSQRVNWTAKLLCVCDTIFPSKVLICFLDRTWLNKVTSTTSLSVSWSHRLAYCVSYSGGLTYSKSKAAQLGRGEGCFMLSELKVSLSMCTKRHKHLLVSVSFLHNDTFPI